MDLGKIDTGLCSYLASGANTPGPINVFVRTHGPLGPQECITLSGLGIRNVVSNKTTYAARLTIDNIKKLSQLPWITKLTLAQTLNPLPASQQIAS